jgi:glycine cleavage system H protein
VTFVELPKKESTVRQGEEIFSFETIKAAISLPSPFDGVIAEVNSNLNNKPELINADPYGEGWIVLVSFPNFEKNKQSLLTAESYFELMKSKIKDQQKRVKDQ